VLTEGYLFLSTLDCASSAWVAGPDVRLADSLTEEVDTIAPSSKGFKPHLDPLPKGLQISHTLRVSRFATPCRRRHARGRLGRCRSK
jgi:hypothetical protein